MTKYKAILLDLFDTLVDFNNQRLPVVKFRGTAKHSTGEVVYTALREFYNTIEFDEFYHVFVQSYKEVDDLRIHNCREIPSQERFRRLLIQLGIEAPPSSVVEQLVTVHMDQLFLIMEFPEERRGIVERLRSTYRLGIVSNFDHPPTAYRILELHRLRPYFDAIIISGEIGWRKPHPRIFQSALTALGVDARETLFVGDTPAADIVGAKGVGMDVTWIDHELVTLDPSTPRPDYMIRDFKELVSLLT